jgi:hypothetical protein
MGPNFTHAVVNRKGGVIMPNQEDFVRRGFFLTQPRVAIRATLPAVSWPRCCAFRGRRSGILGFMCPRSFENFVARCGRADSPWRVRGKRFQGVCARLGLTGYAAEGDPGCDHKREGDLWSWAPMAEGSTASVRVVAEKWSKAHLPVLTVRPLARRNSGRGPAAPARVGAWGLYPPGLRG